jgi:hypothetical protein
VQFFPENGLISTESFRYMVNDCLPSTEAEVVIQVDYPYPDECNVALEVENGLINISTLQATNSPEPFDATQCSDSDIGSMQKDIWLKYVACENGTLTVDGCELLTFDSDLAMYEGDCCNLVQLGCNGDSTDCQGGASSLSIEVEVGNSYFIRLGGSIESSEGGGTIFVDGPVGSCIQSCYCDLEVDGVVNVADLLLIIGRWGDTCGAADLNVDGQVDVMDVLLVIGAWGPCEG